MTKRNCIQCKGFDIITKIRKKLVSNATLPIMCNLYLAIRYFLQYGTQRESSRLELNISLLNTCNWSQKDNLMKRILFGIRTFKTFFLLFFFVKSSQFEKSFHRAFFRLEFFSPFFPFFGTFFFFKTFFFFIFELFS